MTYKHDTYVTFLIHHQQEAGITRMFSVLIHIEVFDHGA